MITCTVLGKSAHPTRQIRATDVNGRLPSEGAIIRPSLPTESVMVRPSSLLILASGNHAGAVVFTVIVGFVVLIAIFLSVKGRR